MKILSKRRIVWTTIAGGAFGIFPILLLGPALNGPLVIGIPAQIISMISGILIFVIPLIFGTAIGHIPGVARFALFIANGLLWAFLFNIPNIIAARRRNRATQ